MVQFSIHCQKQLENTVIGPENLWVSRFFKTLKYIRVKYLQASLGILNNIVHIIFCNPIFIDPWSLTQKGQEGDMEFGNVRLTCSSKSSSF